MKPKLKFDVSEYNVVEEKSTGRYFAVLKSDTPFGAWNDLLDQEINCIPISSSGILEFDYERFIKRSCLNENVWVRG